MQNKIFLVIFFGIMTLVQLNFSHAALISVQIGDADNFGFGNIGESLPSFNFDNRTEDDPSYTDVAYPAFNGPGLNELFGNYNFSYAPLNETILSGSLDIHIHGLETAFPGKKISVDGINLGFELDDIDQGAFGHSIISISLDSILSNLVDGNLDVQIENIITNNPDTIAIDWMRLDIQTADIPTPSTIWLLGPCLIGLLGFRKPA